MTNVKKAIAAMNEVDDYIDFLPDNAAYAHALEGQGLLAPDLPEPDAVKLNGDIKYFVGEGKQVRFDKASEFISVMLNTPLLASEARKLAYALLSAADYAERDDHNE